MAQVRYVHARDGVRLALTVLPPVGQPRGAVLVLHGFSQNRKAFLQGKLPCALAEAGLWVAVGELRGHGRSERPRIWTIEDHLHLDLPRLAEETADLGGVERIHFLGHSMGGMLGYVSLAGEHRFVSVTTIASPLRLGRGSPLVGLAARVSQPAVWLAGEGHLPIDRFLALLARPLSVRTGFPLLAAVQRVLALTNPWEADPEALEEVLRSSDPESLHVFGRFLALAVARKKVIAGVDVLEAVRSTPIPVCAIVGGRDIFAPPRAVDELVRPGHAGPRRVVVLPRGAHVDLTVGPGVANAAVQLLPFWEV